MAHAHPSRYSYNPLGVVGAHNTFKGRSAMSRATKDNEGWNYGEPKDLSKQLDDGKRKVYDHKGHIIEIQVDVIDELLYKLLPLSVAGTRQKRVANVQEAKAKLQSLINSAVIEARIDELKSIVLNGSNGQGEFLSKSRFDRAVINRIKELKNE